MFEASEIATCNVPLCSRYDRVKEMVSFVLLVLSAISEYN